MLDDSRRKILRDMNIDVWVLRAAPGAPVSKRVPDRALEPPGAPAGGSTASPAAAARAALASSGGPNLGSRSADASRDSARREAPSAGAREPEPAAAPGDAFVVVSVALPGIVLLLEGGGSRRDMRLARDVVSAAAGAWEGKPVRRRFVWPPATTVMDPPAGEHRPGQTASHRALRAFVDKDLQDHRAARVIYVGAVAEWLPDDWPGVRVIRVPALADFSRDPQAKRRLWTELCGSAP